MTINLADTRFVAALPEAEQQAIRARLNRLSPENWAEALEGRVSDLGEALAWNDEEIAAVTIKTPQEIAAATFATMHSQAAEACENEILAHIVTAIEVDRAQRDIYELITEALEERAEGWGDEMPARAAEAIRSGEHDDIWDRFIGPMLDSLESELGR